jgi:hypothetical protein
VEDRDVNTAINTAVRAQMKLKVKGRQLGAGKVEERAGNAWESQAGKERARRRNQGIAP